MGQETYCFEWVAAIGGGVEGGAQDLDEVCRGFGSPCPWGSEVHEACVLLSMTSCDTNLENSTQILIEPFCIVDKRRVVRVRSGTYLTTINVISNKKSGLFDEGTPAQ